MHGLQIVTGRSFGVTQHFWGILQKLSQQNTEAMSEKTYFETVPGSRQPVDASN